MTWAHHRSLTALMQLAEQLDASPPATLADFAARLPAWLDGLSWAAPLARQMLAAIQTNPLRDAPMRGFAMGPLWGVGVAEYANAGVTLGLLDSLHPVDDNDSRLVFGDSFSLTMLIDGGPLAIDRFDRSVRGGPIDSRQRQWLRSGDQLLLDHRHSQIRMAELARDAVFLRIGSNRLDADAVAWVYDSDSGLPVRQLCGDIAASRMMALIDVAAASARPDKAAVLAALIDHPLPALRW